MTPTQKNLVALACILVLATAARLWDITHYPPGLYPDQAANGEDALSILRGDLHPFYPRNNGREGFLLYAQALTVGLLGVGVWPLFVATALLGIATVGATYAAGKQFFGERVGLLAAFFLATNPWHITLSRTGFRAATTPLFIALSLWGIGRVLRPAESHGKARRWLWRDAILAGTFTGLGLYTYTAYRAYLIFLVFTGVLAAVRAVLQPVSRARLRVLLTPVAVAAGVALLVAAPLLLFFLRNPMFLGVRAQHVSVFNPDLNHGDPLGTFLTVTGRTLRAFAWDGDGNPRHNVPLPGLPYRPGGAHAYTGGGAPHLSLVPLVLALMGLTIALRRGRWLVLLFLVGLLPAVTTAEGIPHGLRSVGAIPAHVWFAALGGIWLWDKVRARAPTRRQVHLMVACGMLGVSAVWDLWLYFGLARNSPLAHYEYRADLTAVSAYLNTRVSPAYVSDGNPRVLPYLVLDDFSAQTVHFLTTNTRQPYRLVRPEESQRLPLAPGEEIIFAQSTLVDAARFRRAHPESVVRLVQRNQFGELVMTVFTLP